VGESVNGLNDQLRVGAAVADVHPNGMKTPWKVAQHVDKVPVHHPGSVCIRQADPKRNRVQPLKESGRDGARIQSRSTAGELCLKEQTRACASAVNPRARLAERNGCSLTATSRWHGGEPQWSSSTSAIASISTTCRVE